MIAQRRGNSTDEPEFTMSNGPLPWEAEFKTAFVQVDHQLEKEIALLCEEPGFPCAALKFDLAHYSDELYGRFNVERPEQFHCWSEKRKAEHLAGRLSVMRSSNAQITVKIGKNREPLWPNGVVGSISHDADTALSVLSSSWCYLIGVDIEPLISVTDWDWLAEEVLGPKERCLVEASDIALQRWLPTALFSAKESFYKAIYPLTQCIFGFDVLTCTDVNHRQLLFEVDAEFRQRMKLPLPSVVTITWTVTSNQKVVTFIRQKRSSAL
ncbi:4'-phosphopantetheinyl transferase [Vibrio sp. FF112]|uniref:4'-phosphopantetheinyl transferase family protein n=1 Tax=Vibrio sp. FF112 TaxID=3230008 RepID=UPI00352EC17C